METHLYNMRKESNEKCKTLADTVIKMYGKMSKLEKAAKELMIPKEIPKGATKKKRMTKPRLSGEDFVIVATSLSSTPPTKPGPKTKVKPTLKQTAKPKSKPTLKPTSNPPSTSTPE